MSFKSSENNRYGLFWPMAKPLLKNHLCNYGHVQADQMQKKKNTQSHTECKASHIFKMVYRVLNHVARCKKSENQSFSGFCLWVNNGSFFRIENSTDTSLSLLKFSEFQSSVSKNHVRTFSFIVAQAVTVSLIVGEIVQVTEHMHGMV